MINDSFFINVALKFNINELEIRDALKKKWKSLQDFYSQPSNQTAFKKRINFFLSLIKFKTGIKILDIGCGVGQTIIELANMGATCTGLDIDKDCIQLLTVLSDEYKLDLEPVFHNANVLSFNSNTFDVVMSEQFFEHVTDLNQCLSEQVRVLKKRGRLFIEQANILNPFILIDLLIKYPLRTHGKFGGLKWLFTKRKVRENIYNSGWAGRDEDIHTRFWWKKLIRKVPNLHLEKFTSYWTELSGGLKILEPIMGNIIILAVKK
ncbi:MAG: class I SAM-dependent methyltransferase [Candidatus Helarchaeota archaeon]